MAGTLTYDNPPARPFGTNARNTTNRPAILRLKAQSEMKNESISKGSVRPAR